MILKRMFWGFALIVVGVFVGVSTQSLVAQVIEIEQKALSDDRSDWTVFVGNNDKFDSTVWVVRYNRVTGETWYKDGKKYIVVASPNKN